MIKQPILVENWASCPYCGNEVDIGENCKKCKKEIDWSWLHNNNDNKSLYNLETWKELYKLKGKYYYTLKKMGAGQIGKEIENGFNVEDDIGVGAWVREMINAKKEWDKVKKYFNDKEIEEMKK